MATNSDVSKETYTPSDTSPASSNVDAGSLWNDMGSISQTRDTASSGVTTDSRSIAFNTSSIYNLNNDLFSGLGKSDATPSNPGAAPGSGGADAGSDASRSPSPTAGPDSGDTTAPPPSPPAGDAADLIQADAAKLTAAWAAAGVGQERGGSDKGTGVNQDAKDLFAAIDAATAPLLEDFQKQEEAAAAAAAEEEAKSDQDADGITDKEDKDVDGDGVEDEDDQNHNHLSDADEQRQQEEAAAQEKQESTEEASDNYNARNFDAQISSGNAPTSLGLAESQVNAESARIATQLGDTSKTGDQTPNTARLLNSGNQLQQALERLRAAIRDMPQGQSEAD